MRSGFVNRCFDMDIQLVKQRFGRGCVLGTSHPMRDLGHEIYIEMLIYKDD
jgi:hypothetical protein